MQDCSRTKRKSTTSYIVYDRDEMPVVVGSAKECAKALGMTHASFLTLVTRTRNGERKGYRYLAYKIEEEI